MDKILGILKNTISMFLFHKGQTCQIFESVKKTDAKVVMKNNRAECVLISLKEYMKFIDQLNDAKLLIQSTERMKK